MSVSQLSNEDLLKELKNRGLLTNSKTNDLVLSELTNTSVKVILTFGLPTEKMSCRECNEFKESDKFSFYQTRVSADGFLMRSNALCVECSKESNKKRKIVLDSADIPEKPKKGDVCINCDRSWNGNWHRHHVDDKYIGYICGHCNMSFNDQRNKTNNLLDN
jgi:hypothetical protein